MTRRAFLGAYTSVAVLVLSGCSRYSSHSFIPPSLLPSSECCFLQQGVNGNLCLRFALSMCRRFLLVPKKWAACVAIVYSLCLREILTP